jgi:alpha-ribazole phosphatase
MGLIVWRHPRPWQVEGRCIGRTDVPVDRRKAKRLAHRIRAWARRRQAPRVVVTSPLRRAADVGRWLAAWGWSHRIDPRLSELDFGRWDGQRWDRIGKEALDDWTSEFATYRPGAGESVGALVDRCAAFVANAGDACVVAHAGWISAAVWLAESKETTPIASQWPAGLPYGRAISLR